MSADFGDVQRIVLHGTRWRAARHLMLGFGDKSPLHFLNGLLKAGYGPTGAKDHKEALQYSLGLTRRGLERCHVPDNVLARFALKSPAFWAGAALRAAGRLGMTDDNSPQRWDPMFRFMQVDAVLSVHSTDKALLSRVIDGEKGRDGKEGKKGLMSFIVTDHGLACAELPLSCALPAPPDVKLPADDNLPAGSKDRGQWVHFGFLDGLSRVGIKGSTPQKALDKCRPISIHATGEFVLGHVQDSGGDPWVAGPGRRIWPDKVRAFFRNGSFGVLQQIEQDVGAFEKFVNEQAAEHKLGAEVIKGKLCGRYPDGRPLVAPDSTDPGADFDYAHDPEGLRCPFGSHVRRMNPRLRAAEGLNHEHEARAAHFSRSRPLLRRGMPYGDPWTAQSSQENDTRRGLIGQFFCASIEDQYEHLLGEWADRVPLGSPDGGGARDPLIGAHESGDGPFEIPQPPHESALRLKGLTPFTRTIGAAYLFYPSLKTLQGIADSSLWGADDEDDDNEAGPFEADED